MLVGDSDNEERQKLVDRTRGVLFYSTPHLGTPSAGLWNNAKYLLLPSVEVQELKQGKIMMLYVQVPIFKQYH